MAEITWADALKESEDTAARDPNLWAQCFAESDGDEAKARALYVKRRMPKPIEAPKGFCPNCTSECAMDARSCPKCGADFIGGGWKPQLTKPRPAYGTKVNELNSNLVKTTKSRGIYVILALFFGLLGVHNFYIGRFARGAMQFLCTVILGWFVVGLLIAAIWAVIDMFTVTTDSAGDPLS